MPRTSSRVDEPRVDEPRIDEPRIDGRRVDGIDALIVGSFVLIVYLCFGQITGHGDGPIILLWYEAGLPALPNHMLYMTELRLVAWLGGFVGLSVYDSAIVLSAAGAAFGVAFVHLANRWLGLGRVPALLATGLVAATPALVFYATVLEVHAPFFALAGIWMYLSARWLSRPGYGAAVCVGLASALAYTAHTSGHLLPGVVVLMRLVQVYIATRRPAAWLAELGRIAVIFCSHAIFVALAIRLGSWLLPGFDPRYGVQFAADLARANLSRFDMLGSIIWTEWLVAFAPSSVLVLLALRQADGRVRLAGLAVATTAYIGLAFFLLASLHQQGDYEYGAYLLPLAWPMAALVVVTVPRWLAIIAIVCGAGLSICRVEQHDEASAAHAYIDGVHAVAAGKPCMLIIGRRVEVVTLSALTPKQPRFQVTTLLTAADLPGFLAGVDQAIQKLHAQGHGVFLSHGARQSLMVTKRPQDEARGDQILEFLEARYRLERVEQAGFRGERVLPHD